MEPAADNLVWIDLEMTGLEPERCFIMEIGTLITNSQLELVAEGPDFVVHNDEAQLASLSEWCKDHFGRTGFIEKVKESRTSAREAELQTLAFIKQHVLPGTAPLFGNSVHNDRAFLYQHMRELHDFLHYRNIDVSTVKEVVERWYPGKASPPPKADLHRAMTDIRESVLELRYYREHFFIKP